MYKKSLFIFLIMSSLMILIGGDWKKDGDKWCYYDRPYEKCKNQIVKHNDDEYYLDSKGNMKTGWVGDMYFKENGIRLENGFTPEGRYILSGVELKGFKNYLDKSKSLIRTEYKKNNDVNFMIMDLNSDDCMDIIFLDEDYIYSIYLWDLDIKNYKIILDTDKSLSERSYLYKKDEKLYYINATLSHTNCFSLGDTEKGVEFLADFSRKINEYNEIEYFVDDERCDYRDYMRFYDDIFKNGQKISNNMIAASETNIRNIYKKLMPDERNIYMFMDS